MNFVTINPAIQLGIDHRVGSIEKGKDADFVIWSGDPLSSYSICEQTWIDGRKYFDNENDQEMLKRDKKIRNELIQRVLSSPEKPDHKHSGKHKIHYKEHSCGTEIE